MSGKRRTKGPLNIVQQQCEYSVWVIWTAYMALFIILVMWLHFHCMELLCSTEVMFGSSWGWLNNDKMLIFGWKQICNRKHLTLPSCKALGVDPRKRISPEVKTIKYDIRFLTISSYYCTCNKKEQRIRVEKNILFAPLNEKHFQGLGSFFLLQHDTEKLTLWQDTVAPISTLPYWGHRLSQTTVLPNLLQKTMWVF